MLFSKFCFKLFEDVGLYAVGKAERVGNFGEIRIVKNTLRERSTRTLVHSTSTPGTYCTCPVRQNTHKKQHELIQNPHTPTQHKREEEETIHYTTVAHRNYTPAKLLYNTHFLCSHNTAVEKKQADKAEKYLEHALLLLARIISHNPPSTSHSSVYI